MSADGSGPDDAEAFGAALAPPSAPPPPRPAVKDLIWLWDGARGRVVWANPAALAFWGAAGADALPAPALAALRAALAGGGGPTVLTGVAGPAPGRLIVSPAALPDGRIGRRAAFAPDPPPETATTDDGLAAAAFEAAPTPLAVLDAGGAALRANAAFRALDGAGRAALASTPLPGGLRLATARGGAAGGSISALALARIAHEFRSPLTAVLGFAEFLREAAETTPPDRLRAYLDDLSAAAERMRRLADDMVALGVGGEGLRLSEASLDDVAADALRLAAPAAAARGVRLDAPTPSGLSALIDAEALGRALGNLIDNAIRHGRAGGRVAVALEDVGRASGATLAVADDGPGMDEAALARARAGRVARGGDGRSGGLGLAIAEEIAEAHGGKLEIETAPGAGLAATIRLPAGRVFRSRPPRR